MRFTNSAVVSGVFCISIANRIQIVVHDDVMVRGAGKNLKVGAHENFCRVPLLLGPNIQISRFGERFRGGQFSFVGFHLLFFY